MFDVIPRWALALGIGTISAAGVSTIAFESFGRIARYWDGYAGF